MNFVKLTLIMLFGLALTTPISSADAIKGQKIYSKKLKVACGINGGRFAAKHTQDEWDNIQKANKLGEEISHICHGVKVQDKLIPDIYDFVKKYASDSGNVPSC
ncbi:MAG TPA: cytochrome C [Campylobacterales bacterium]|nr:cytochrome C [Campylobacterales bacterium]HHC11125.1 cytochrome C [Campylobacterales bacterium]HHD80873.1 cytochrome C [Campylobacterales bacterium]